MANKKTTTNTVNELTEEQIDSFVEGSQALAEWHETNVIRAIAVGVKTKWDTLLENIGKGKEKNNKYNEGYMKALLDIYYSLDFMLKNAEKKYEDLFEEEETTQTEGETNE